MIRTRQWTATLALSLMVHAGLAAMLWPKPDATDVNEYGGSGNGIEIGLALGDPNGDVDGEGIAGDGTTGDEVAETETAPPEAVAPAKPEPEPAPEPEPQPEPQPDPELVAPPELDAVVAPEIQENLVAVDDEKDQEEKPQEEVPTTEPVPPTENAPSTTSTSNTQETASLDNASATAGSAKSGLGSSQGQVGGSVDGSINGSAKGTGLGWGKGHPGSGKARNSREYFGELMSWLNKHKHYPVELKQKKQQGIVEVEFTVDRSGQVTAMSIAKSCGHDLLDQAALQMLSDASPLPPFPKFIDEDNLTLVIPVEYSLITNAVN